MKRLSALILVFSVLFFVFFTILIFFRVPFALYPLMSMQDVVDVVTPFVLLPLYLLLYSVGAKNNYSFCGLIIFSLFAALWASGHGMHLSANSINNLLAQKGMEAGDVYKLTYFYDEVLSHYLLHAGMAGLSALLIYRQWKNPFTEGKTLLWPIILGGLIHGFNYFTIVIEGGTAPLGVTFSVLATVFIIVWARKKMSQQPLVTFFLVAYSLAILLFIIWGIWWKGLPQFSEVGFI